MKNFELNLSTEELEKRTSKEYLTTKKFLTASSPEYIALHDGDKQALKHLVKAAYVIEKINMQLDCKYNLDFKLNHLVKLDPEFNVEITIYDDRGLNLKINSKNPTVKINGYNTEAGNRYQRPQDTIKAKRMSAPAITTGQENANTQRSTVNNGISR